MDLLSSLNEAQQQAVLHFEGPALVVAGAGSGKTRTVVHRIAYLLRERRVYPGEILAVTFTNKAAGEMKERLEKMVGPHAKDLWVSTFHSAALRILRVYGEWVGLKSGFVVYDDDDQGTLLKEILKDLGIEARPGQFRAVLDRIKNRLGGVSEFLREAPDFVAGVPKEQAAEVFQLYQKALRGQGAVDFNDLLLLAIRLFEEQPDVLRKVQQRARFIHVDEYQDTNPVQYKLTRLLAGQLEAGGPGPNLVVVGDPDQCLPPDTLVHTPQGLRPIAELEAGHEVLAASGDGRLAPARVGYVKRGSYRGPLWRVRAGGATLRGTPHHLVPVRMAPEAGSYFVYLMYRHDRGYRVGLTKSLRSNDAGLEELGFKVRLNQERGDKLWLLKVVPSYAEARYHEALFAARYGLPTVLFHGEGRGLKMDEAWFERLYRDLDTETGARRLMKDLWLHPEFPHHRPQNGLNRQSLNLTMYGDRRPGGQLLHRVQWSSVRADVAERLGRAGFAVRSNGRGGYRLETARVSYPEALAFAKSVARLGGMEIVRKMLIGGRSYHLMPLSHLHPGMKVLLQDDSGALREAAVEAVEQADYDGPVYDLELDTHHTYLADGVLVHNSIYGFRNADINNILSFTKDYPGAKVFRLEANYRSTAAILSVANAVIEKNTARLEKTLRPVKGGGDKVRLFRAPSAREEAAFVAREIAKRGNFGQIAVLYRTNAQSRVLEEHLRRAGIPAKLVGAVGFYERREVKDLLAYARVAVNPLDALSLRRIVNTPPRGIGASTVGKLLEHAQRQGISALEAFRHAKDVVSRPQQVEAFVKLVDELIEAAYDTGPRDFLKRVLDETGYLETLRAEPDGEDRIANVEELLRAAGDWEEEVGGTLADFLDTIALTASAEEPAKRVQDGKLEDPDAPQDQVTLMTLHNAKGLEFPVVFLVGVEENLLPHRNSQSRLEDMEEERRLFYVGITRAQETLYLSYAEEREVYGKREYTRESRFLADVPAELLEEVSAFGSGGPAVVIRPARAPEEKKPLSVFKGGEKVRHPRFGQGTVVAALGAEVTVHFPGVGLKKLAVQFAGLERID
ncbi:UvrD-helicase domain-containing protein [Calidithermus chliarophilus]|uniref:UvrD-helicase domain-containing protein n=1 Tax=Calidithermus chliarophilus TaxID=52023 RepID=UPI00041DED7B|nr:UvrD-helicase domain-containing protein [Calidithermus chliarophilus]